MEPPPEKKKTKKTKTSHVLSAHVLGGVPSQ